MPPRVTLGFIGFNRLHYMRAALESARACIDYPNLEWIVSDGCSQEPGLQESLDGCDWIDTRIVREGTHADAMNESVERATGDDVLIRPGDEMADGEGDLPRSFTGLVPPLGWELPIGPDGERLKASINTEVSAPVVEEA